MKKNGKTYFEIIKSEIDKIKLHHKEILNTARELQNVCEIQYIQNGLLELENLGKIKRAGTNEDGETLWQRVETDSDNLPNGQNKNIKQ